MHFKNKCYTAVCPNCNTMHDGCEIADGNWMLDINKVTIAWNGYSPLNYESHKKIILTCMKCKYEENFNVWLAASKKRYEDDDNDVNVVFE